MPDGTEHSVLLAASEVVDFAKTGGLADVVGALPRALQQRGHSCAVILPLYRCVRLGSVPLTPTEHRFSLPIGEHTIDGRLWQSALPGSTIPVYLVEQPEYFERDDAAQGRGLYQRALPDGTRRDYPDNCERFVFFCRAVLEALRLLDYWPDVLHLNDWQTGLVPIYLREVYQPPAMAESKLKYRRVRTVFTVHNIAYQGFFWPRDLHLTGLDWSLFNPRYLEFYGGFSFLKAGLVFADMLTTVSPTYAREIQTPYYGCGLEGVLLERRQRLHGIVNGVDYNTWNPDTDPHLATTYRVNSVVAGKAACKVALQRRFGAAVEPRTPILGVVSRLVEQKGLSLIVKVADALLQRDNIQLVVLGEGDPVYHRALADLQCRYPRQVGLMLAFDEALAHQIEAGADLFLMPSLYEPSGLNQLYSLRYGTVPVVRSTGGLADTITDCTPQTLVAGTATGFTFVSQTAAAFQSTVERAVQLYREAPQQWLQIVQTGMRQDWSWNRSAAAYEALYSELRQL